MRETHSGRRAYILSGKRGKARAVLLLLILCEEHITSMRRVLCLNHPLEGINLIVIWDLGALRERRHLLLRSSTWHSAGKTWWQLLRGILVLKRVGLKLKPG